MNQENIIEDLTNKIKELEENKLRIVAEMDNFKKRIKKENKTYKKFILTSFVESLLPFLDNLERGLNVTSGTEDYKALKEGFNLALTGYKDTLKTFGIEAYDSVGEDFNPMFHNALGMEKHYGIEKNKITDEIAKGYFLNGKVVRPAAVIVSA